MSAVKTARELFYTKDDVKAMLDYSDSKAYQIIADLNKELKASGFLTRDGMIPKKYFDRRYGLTEPDIKAGRRVTA